MCEYGPFKLERDDDVHHIGNPMHNWTLRKSKQSCHFRSLQVRVWVSTRHSQVHFWLSLDALSNFFNLKSHVVCPYLLSLDTLLCPSSSVTLLSYVSIDLYPPHSQRRNSSHSFSLIARGTCVGDVLLKDLRSPLWSHSLREIRFCGYKPAIPQYLSHNKY